MGAKKNDTAQIDTLPSWAQTYIKTLEMQCDADKDSVAVLRDTANILLTHFSIIDEICKAIHNRTQESLSRYESISREIEDKEKRAAALGEMTAYHETLRIINRLAAPPRNQTPT